MILRLLHVSLKWYKKYNKGIQENTPRYSQYYIFGLVKQHKDKSQNFNKH